MSDTQPTWLSPRQLAARWQVSADSIRLWVANGTVKAMQLGGPKGVLRISLEEVLLHERAAVHEEAVKVIRQIRRRKFAVVDRVGEI